MSVSNSSSTSSVTTKPFRPLRFVTLRTARQVSIESLPPIPAEIQRTLDDKEWLLEPGQHVTFPPSMIDDMANQRIFTPSDFVSIIEKATNDDLQAAAFDPDNGKRRQLNSDQWNEIKATGEVTVPSVLFENQHHRWRLARGFYSSIRAIRESFTEGIGKVLDHWIIYAPRWIFGRNQNEFDESDRWSVLGSLRRGTWRTASTLVSALDQIWGSPLQHPKYAESTIDTILECAENAYVMHHLKKENLDVPALVSLPFIRDVFRHTDAWIALESDAATTWNRNFRPNSSDFESQRQAFTLLESVRQGFDEAMTEKRSSLFNLPVEKTFSSPKAAMAELQTAESDWLKQMEEAWDDELRTNTRLDNIGKVQANQNQAGRIQDELKQEDAKEVEKEREAKRVELQKKHLLLSLSSEWLQHKVLEFEKKKKAAMDASRPTRFVARLREANLVSPAREQELRQEFQTKLKAPIQKQLQSQRLACPPAKFKVPIFHPGKWHYTDDMYAARYSSTEIGQGYFRHISITWITVVGHVKRYRDVPVHVGHRFWRFNYTLKLFLSRTMSYFGGCYHFLVSGPLSLRALLSKDPFFAYKRIKSSAETTTLVGGQSERSQQIFDLEDDPSSFTPTLYSRLSSFYEALAQVRERFEASPDTGLIGKHIQRIFLRGYLVLKGVVGTTIIGDFMVVGSLLATVITLVGVLLAPVIAIATVVVETLFHLLVFDFPQSAATERSATRNRYSWLQHSPAETNSLGPVAKMAIVMPYHALTGCLVATFSAIRGFLFHPLVGSIQLVWTTARLVLRLVRDFLIWNLVIRPAAKVPAADSFLAKRVHGPGLASEYYFRIPLESAQTSVRLSLDAKRVQAYAKLQEAEIMEPFSRYDSLFDTALKPFGIIGQSTEQGPSSVKNMMIRAWQENWPSCFTRDFITIDVDGGLPVPNDLLDSLGQQIRSANPDYINLQDNIQRDKWDHRNVSTFTPGMDQEVMDSLEEPVISDTNIARQYKSMASRAGRLLAEQFLRQLFRDARIRQLSTMPPQSRGRFKLSAPELDQLWKYTLEQTEECLTTLEQELSEYAKKSTFADVLLPKARNIMNEIYTSVGGRPGVDIPLVAANLLTTLFGTDAMHATLEDVDQTMVLMPKRSELDRHYDFGLFGNSKAWIRLYE